MTRSTAGRVDHFTSENKPLRPLPPDHHVPTYADVYAENTRLAEELERNKAMASSAGFAAVLLLAVVVILSFVMVWWSRPADAAPLCGNRGQILSKLAKAPHLEEVRALGLSADGGVIELTVSPDGAWTMLVTYPKRPTCVIAVGQAWQSLPPALTGNPT